MSQKFYTYITTNPNRTVLYTGMTNNLQKRIVEHYLKKELRKPMQVEISVTVLFGTILFLVLMKQYKLKNISRERTENGRKS
ncbi:MAG: GIY-YIG nuclease family protein [Balneola sp.]